MKVVVCEHAGTCYGVKRALDMVMSLANGDKSVQTLGALIHNPLVVEDLASRGVTVASDPLSVSSEVVVIRSHGITPAVADELASLDVEVVDATCPHVIRAQKAAQRLAAQGLPVLIVGEAGHPEVEGLVAWAQRDGGRAYVVGDRGDIPSGLKGPVGVVVQTTQTAEKRDGVCDALADLGISYELCDTICSATSERQDSALRLSSDVDAMVVVGGKNSSNTTRLFEICAGACPKAIHVESAQELDRAWFEGAATIGVTAGASTPECQIRQVVECLLTW